LLLRFLSSQLPFIPTLLVLSPPLPSVLTTIFRTRPSTIQPHQPHEDDYSYPPSQYLHVLGHTLLAPSPATSPVPTQIASPSLTAIHSLTPSSPATQTPFTPKRCGWVGCESDTLWTTKSGLLRHLRRYDHLLAHQRRRHGF
jgi:hypothetical protein